MSSRSSRLNRLVSLAEAEERQFGAQTRRAEARMAKQTARLGELNAFRQQFAENCGRTGILTAALLKDRQNFAERLDQAIRAQQRIVNDCERDLETHRRQWQLKRQRVESLIRIRDRFEAQERVHAARAEQRTQDDMPPGVEFYEEPN